MTRTLVVWGCTSGAGKSWLTTALCRVAQRRGIDVVPFKAQNMSNNARVVELAGGGFGEIGTAQYLQAQAACAAPSVDMNPVLLKPERDTASQVIVHGRVDAALSRMQWRARSAHLAQAARASFERLAARHALIIVEGAGSPAEINLAPQDYVNLGTARWAQQLGQVKALLVSDIDRGGAFAHLYGTTQLLPADPRPILAGHVLNRFRGDPALLAPAPEQLQALTGAPTLAVIPLIADHGLPEEDGWFGSPADAQRVDAARTVAIIATPRISNLDEFAPLAQLPGVRMQWARHPTDLSGADIVILPGSKQVSGDLRWLRAQGLDRAIQSHATAGGLVLGICGGLQMLGMRLDDPQGVDGEVSCQSGLELLNVTTHYYPDKLVHSGAFRYASLAAPWQPLSERMFTGYQIRCGQTEAYSTSVRPILHSSDGQPVGWQSGAVLGIAAHGMLEDPQIQQALFGCRTPPVERAINRLADVVETAFANNTLDELLG